MLDPKRQRLAQAIWESEQTIEEVLAEAGYYSGFDPADLVCQAILARGLAKRGDKPGSSLEGPIFEVFMSLSKTTNMLEYMCLSEKEFGKVTEQTLLKSMRIHPALQIGLKIYPMSEKEIKVNCLYLIREAVPVIVDFGGAVRKPKGEYQLTETGRKAAQIWAEDEGEKGGEEEKDTKNPH